MMEVSLAQAAAAAFASPLLKFHEALHAAMTSVISVAVVDAVIRKAKAIATSIFLISICPF